MNLPPHPSVIYNLDYPFSERLNVPIKQAVTGEFHLQLVSQLVSLPLDLYWDFLCLHFPTIMDDFIAAVVFGERVKDKEGERDKERRTNTTAYS